tara:strand:- start:454 stop:636 length:183 start_codon:yes stop_codon:yes gene_type:complete
MEKGALVSLTSSIAMVVNYHQMMVMERILIALAMEKHGGLGLVRHHLDVKAVRHQVVTNQ